MIFEFRMEEIKFVNVIQVKRKIIRSRKLLLCEEIDVISSLLMIVIRSLISLDFEYHGGGF